MVWWVKDDVSQRQNQVTTGHYSSDRKALLFKPGTYATRTACAGCIGGSLQSETIADVMLRV